MKFLAAKEQQLHDEKQDAEAKALKKKQEEAAREKERERRRGQEQPARPVAVAWNQS